MIKTKKTLGVIIVTLVLLICASGQSYADEFKFPVGFTYISGFNDVFSLYKDNLEAEGYDVSGNTLLPIGLTFQPYYQFDNGIGVGLGVGPVSYIIVEKTDWSGDSTYMDFTDVPVQATVRYTFVPSSDISPYVRAGVSYHFASGDYVNNSNPGALGSVGVEFFRKSRVGFGLDVSYDSSTVEFDKIDNDGSMDKKSIAPGGLMVSIFAIF